MSKFVNWAMGTKLQGADNSAPAHASEPTVAEPLPPGAERVEIAASTPQVVVGQDLYSRLYASSQEVLVPLVQALVDMLARYGCDKGNSEGRRVFGDMVREAFTKMLRAAPSEPPLSQLQIRGASDQVAALMTEMLKGFGANAETASSLGRMMADADPEVTARNLDVSDNAVINRHPSWTRLNLGLSHVYVRGCLMHDRLKRLIADLREPFGSGQRDGGLDQVCERIKMFPDVAHLIYEGAGVSGLASFPPRVTGGVNSTGMSFKAAADEWAADESRWEIIGLAGLIVAGVALTVFSLGTLGPVGAALVGTGVGVLTGAAQVSMAATELQRVEDAARYGAASPDSVEFARNNLQGAWAGLAVNVVTAGLLSRVGANALVTPTIQTLKVTTVSAGAGAVATMGNPNVWEAPNTTALIAWGTVIGGGSALAGNALASAALRAGTRMQIGVSRVDGPLRMGSQVKVQLEDGGPVHTARVVHVNSADDAVTLDVMGQRTLVKVGKLQRAAHDPTAPSSVSGSLRAATPDDFPGARQYAAYLADGSGPIAVTAMPNGTFRYWKDGGYRTTTLRMLRVPDTRARGSATTTPGKDIAATESATNTYATVRNTPGVRGYYVRESEETGGMRLMIFPGPSKDHNGAFKNRQLERPDFPIDMRGRGPHPGPEEIAAFGAHGSPFGFAGMSTEKGARLVADAIVAFNSRGPRTALRCVALDSCSQGTKRFLLVGKTNAESFQKHLDARLTELGFDPQGPNQVTVLGSDRAGSLYGRDVKVGANQFEPTTYVPAGTQRPLTYGADVRRQLTTLGLWVVGVLTAEAAAIGGIAIGIKFFKDPDAAMAWFEETKNKVLAWILEDQPTSSPGSRGRNNSESRKRR